MGCPSARRWGAELRIIAFIGRDQTDPPRFRLNSPSRMRMLIPREKAKAWQEVGELGSAARSPVQALGRQPTSP